MAEAKEEFREPFAEIGETKAGARLIVELPGVPQDSIKMEVSRDLVTVVGKGSRGNFKTIQVMPFDPDPENVVVTYSNGVLVVEVARMGSGEGSPQANGTVKIEPPGKGPDAPVSDLEKVSQEKGLLEERARILQRDFHNLKRRHEGEKESIADRKVTEIAMGLIEVLDDFNRARESVLMSECPKGTSDNILKGLEMVERRVHGLFDSIGIKRIRSIGMHFDPLYHEAIGRSSDPKIEDDMITDEKVAGFFYKKDALRPSQVIVNRRPDEKGADNKEIKR